MNTTTDGITSMYKRFLTKVVINLCRWKENDKIYHIT